LPGAKLLGVIDQLAVQSQREHEAILARIDLRLKGLGHDIETRTAVGRSAEGWSSADPRSRVELLVRESVHPLRRTADE
jgi:hypothetical protein